MAALKTILWGIYCASSWTWCIGMYLPIIMLERYGWPGFWVFAIPNVLGCAAFGYVVKTPRKSRELVAKHNTAMRWFSAATIAFHAFFATFLFGIINAADSSAGVIGAGFALFILAGLASELPRFRRAKQPVVQRDRQRGGGMILMWPIIALGVYLLSIYAFSTLDFTINTEIEPTRPLSELLWLSPIIIIGFALCPYLDFTFHHALQQSPSRHSFAVFGGTFFIMILLTCAYASPELRTGIILAHIVLQMMFTIAVHSRAIVEHSTDGRPRALLSVGVPLLALGIAPLILHFAADPITTGTDTYLRFLVFYGLIFPLYVILYFRRRAGQTSARTVIFTSGVILGGIALELAFNQGYPIAATITAAAMLGLIIRPGKRPIPTADGPNEPENRANG